MCIQSDRWGSVSVRSCPAEQMLFVAVVRAIVVES